MNPMEEEDHGLEMGHRLSRKRRHLPLAATHSVNEKPTERKKVSTFKMTTSPLNGKGGTRHKKSNTRKLYLGIICTLWALFMLYRFYHSIKQGNVARLSIVHFLSGAL
ncbi:hypothetical protein K501DRAFT_288978 [Backusella circina FSU 941]|nr:hypothetical protein K501DRAFT_288978 [Backusella circina FSU 941]